MTSDTPRVASFNSIYICLPRNILKSADPVVCYAPTGGGMTRSICAVPGGRAPLVGEVGVDDRASGGLLELRSADAREYWLRSTRCCWR
jgi:hypothetical protein